jgi:hypothetical protein
VAFLINEMDGSPAGSPKRTPSFVVNVHAIFDIDVWPI